MVAVPVTGRLETSRLTGEPLPRATGMPTPCQSCPKTAHLPSTQQNPLSGRQSELSAKNQQTLALYWQTKGCAGAGMTIDDITRRNFGILEQERERAEGMRRAEELAGALMGLGMLKGTP